MTLTLTRWLSALQPMRLGGLSLLIWLCWMVPALALELKIALKEGVSQIAVGSSTSATITNGMGQPVGQLPPLQGYFAKAASGAVALNQHQAWQLVVQPSDNGLVYIGDRWYRGSVRLVRTSQGFAVINQVDLEDYLASVVGKEMYPSWPQEALKAQAVAARSYALFRRQRQQSQLYDLGNTTTYQVYDGINSETESTRSAVQATAGQILTYQGKVIEAVFHSASGGHTENSENVWSAAVPYLRGVPDFDQSAPVYQWTLELTASQMRQRIPGIGNIVAFEPLQTTPTGRIRSLRVRGDAGSRTLTGAQARQALGLRSTLFSVQPQLGPLASQPGGSAAKSSGFKIQGRGYGHGLGMSQWGAYSLATQGKTYADILRHYYQGTTVSNLGS
ncbi:SpoIID/LytB domain-containing protein [Synechococcales cyanobacterium C]|uniref:SpoIID/LytB domain-containing protein n=1 Tax=Petrachloros mirabilis ULC683 TaxID=2781853 RepID=A0A8K2A6E9_9CYAN|nr:SpoIID/LytB domain-containing protein [Petrachloros mirabilis]NCJ05289.1 SpoIID/LytB domain-containing protein [Petrachloros mirabilis ULC683]